MIDTFEIVKADDLTTVINHKNLRYYINKYEGSSTPSVRAENKTVECYLVNYFASGAEMQRELIEVPGRSPLDVTKHIFGTNIYNKANVSWTIRVRLKTGITRRIVDDGYKAMLQGKDIGIRFWDSTKEDTTNDKQNAYWVGVCKYEGCVYSCGDKCVDVSFSMECKPFRLFPQKWSQQVSAATSDITVMAGCVRLLYSIYPISYTDDGYAYLGIDGEPFTCKVREENLTEIYLYEGTHPITIKSGSGTINFRLQDGVF